MATSVADAFTQFQERIALTSPQQSSAMARQKRSKEFLEKHFPASYELPLRSAVPMGSTERGTAIRPLDDIDLLAVFDNKDGVFERYRNDSQAFLYRIKNRIDAKTTVQQVGARGQAVRLFYNDGLHVDIAPVFRWASGGYCLPAGDGGWILTDPLKQADWVEGRETALSGQFKRRVRILRRWNAVHSRRLGSWHLEVIVGRTFNTMSSNHRVGLMRFFEWAPRFLHVQDPDDLGGDLGAGLTMTQEIGIGQSLSSSHTRSVAAVDAEARGDHKEAIRLWRIILGEDFPAFG